VGSRGIGEGSTCKHHATSRHAPFDADPGDESPARGLDAPSVGVAGGDDAGEEPSGVSLSAGCSSNNINSGASANKHRGRWRMQRSTHNTAQHTAAVPHNTPQAYTLHTAHCTLHTAHCTLHTTQQQSTQAHLPPPLHHGLRRTHRLEQDLRGAVHRHAAAVQRRSTALDGLDALGLARPQQPVVVLRRHVQHELVRYL
jgi:hypothetical protein